MNRYLRFVLYLLLQAGLVSGGVWLYTHLNGVPLTPYGFFTGKFFSFFMLSMVPVIGALGFRKRWKGPAIEGMEVKALALGCSYRCAVKADPAALKEKLKEICNELAFPDSVFVKDYEDETTLAYRSEALQNTLGSKMKKPAGDPSVIVMELIPAGNGTDLCLKSETVGRTVGLNNLTNEQNVSAVLRKLEEAGLVTLTYKKNRSPAKVIAGKTEDDGAGRNPPEN